MPNATEMIARHPFFTKTGKVCGLLCLLWLGYELVGTVIGMWKAFATLSASGLGDPSSLAGGFGEVLAAKAFVVCLFLLGVLILWWVRCQERKLRAIEPPPPPLRQPAG